MKNNIQIVLLGDSIIKRGNWKNLLNTNELVNLGIDGETTLGVYNRLNHLLELKPKFLFLQIGINDLCISSPTIDEIFSIYQKILEKLKDSNIKVIVHAVFITQMASINEKIYKFNSMLKEYCHGEKIDFFDINEFFKNEKGLLKEELTTDGLHLGEKAYKAWAYKISKKYLNK